jgi:hypothetical protein
MQVVAFTELSAYDERSSLARLRQVIPLHNRSASKVREQRTLTTALLEHVGIFCQHAADPTAM